MNVTSAALFDSLPWDTRRGTGAMALLIVTEALLFVVLFFSYFYLSLDLPHWPPDPPPKLTLASIMLVLLLASSAVVFRAERLAKQGRHHAARIAIAVTLVMGMTFLVLQFFEYRDHIRTLKPSTDAYGSIFYTITSVHGAHVFVGLCMLAYVIALPRLDKGGSFAYSPHRSFHNVSLYWHFVDGVWIVVTLLLYYLPHLQT